MAKPLNKPRRTGFTLLELLLVVSVLSILAGIAVPAVGNAVADQRLVAEGYTVGAWLYDSRMLTLGLKRCVRVRGYVGGSPSGSEFSVDLSALKARELNSGDCETASRVTSDANYTDSALPPFTPTLRADGTPMMRIRLQPNLTGFPVVWRPAGYLRGDSDTDLSDDWFQVRVTDPRNKFVVVRVSSFGQVCTGAIGEVAPSC